MFARTCRKPCPFDFFQKQTKTWTQRFDIGPDVLRQYHASKKVSDVQLLKCFGSLLLAHS